MRTFDSMRGIIRALLALTFVVPVAAAVPSTPVLAATTVTGTITDDLGSPVQDVQVRLCQVVPSGTCTNHLPNAAGVYSVAKPPGDYTIQFIATSDLVSGERWENRVGSEPDDLATVVADQVNVFDAELERRPMVSGVITDDTGQPVEGVQVGICNSTTQRCSIDTSDAAGAYSTRADAQVSTVSFRSPIHSLEYWDDQPTEALSTPVDLTDHEDETLSPVLQLQTSFIAGTVTDDVGAVLEGIRVQACRTDINVCEHTDTDASGAYSLQVDAATFRLEINRAGASQPHRREYFDDEVFFNDAELITLAANETVTADAELATRIAISGTVTDDVDNTPLQGVTVEACGLVNGCRSDTTDALGAYSIEVFAGDSYTVEFDGDGLDYSSEFHDDATEAGAQRITATPGMSVTGIDAGLSDEPNITGTITRTLDSSPVHGALVTACIDVINDCVATTTQPDGTYGIRAEPGAYHVFVDAGFLDLGSKYHADTYDHTQAQLVTVALGTPAAGVDIALEPVGIVRGRVVDSSMQPIDGIEVRVCRLPNVIDCTTPVTGADGRWATVANPGPNFVSFSDPNDVYTPVTWNPTTDSAFDPVEVPSDGIIGDIDVVMSEPGSITGTITDENGVPIENAEVRANGTLRGAATTDAQGDYEMNELGVGTYFVSVTHPDHVRGTYPTDVIVTEGETTNDIDLQLTLSGQINGTVTDPTGAPLANVQVFACAASGACVGSQPLTAVDGSYTVTGVPAGEWFVRFTSLSFTLGTVWFGPAIDTDGATAVTVVAGSAANGVDVMFQEPGVITGLAQLAGSGPLVNGSVTACRTDDTGCVSAQTDVDGRYEFTTILPGTYRLRFNGPSSHAPTFLGDSATVAGATVVDVVSSETNADLDVTLALAATISGTITDADGTGLFPSQIEATACSAAADFCANGYPSNGAYIIGRLPAADDYIVEFSDASPERTDAFQTEWYCNADSVLDAIAINITAGTDTPGIDASVRRSTDSDSGTGSCELPGPTPDPDPIPDLAGFVNALTPARLADSRDLPTTDGRFRNTGRRAGGSTWEIDVAGRADASDNASAAALNVTVLGSDRNGYATVFPCTELPTASSVNFAPGSVSASEVIAQLSASGSVCVYTSAAAHVIIDVVGELTDSTYAPIAPSRFADSRHQPTFDTLFRDTGIRRAGTTWDIQISGRGSIPADATSVVANLTIAGAGGQGFATAYPCGERPTASSVNFRPGRAVANELVAKLSATGSLCIYTSANAHVILDVVGSLDDTVDYRSLTPERFADSRQAPTVDDRFSATGPRRGGTTWEVDIAGRGAVPADATSVVANLTLVRAEGRGYATIYACGDRPPTSSVNFDVGVARPNEVITGLSNTGTICVFTSVDAHVIIDVVGAT